MVMSRMGVDPGFLTWTRLLYLDTRSRARVNDVLSRSCLFTAGVRQGCPLSPLLYLFIAHAIYCYLRAQNYGLPLTLRLSSSSSSHITLFGSQYADDLSVLLPNLDRLPDLLASFNIIRLACGQSLNSTKSTLCCLGGTAADLGILPETAAGGVPVSGFHKSLGVLFGRDAEWEGAAFWEEKCGYVYGKLEKISHGRNSRFWEWEFGVGVRRFGSPLSCRVLLLLGTSSFSSAP